MARKAGIGASAGMSTSTTSGLALWTRRTTGSLAASGKLLQLCTVRATLVPSTRTCNNARCSPSCATTTTESSAIALLLLLTNLVPRPVREEEARHHDLPPDG